MGERAAGGVEGARVMKEAFFWGYVLSPVLVAIWALAMERRP